MAITIRDIQETIRALPPDELSRFRRWFEAFDAQVWDEQFEADAREGKLDRVAEQAIKEYQAGELREL